MKFSKVQVEIRIAILYAVFGGLWILFSDSLLANIAPDYTFYTRLQTYKGWFFVAASAALIYYLIKHEIAKRIETAEKLRASEEALRRFELLAEHSRDIILFMRREDGRILEANAAAMRAYGYSRDELLALSIQDLRARDTQELTVDQMGQADAGGILFETVHLRKDRSIFPVEVSSQGANIGGMRTLVSIIRDITERKRAEEEIASLSKFPTENPNPVLRVQKDGRLAYANAASRELMAMWGCEIDGYLPADMKEQITLAVKSGSIEIVDISCNDKMYSLMLVPFAESGYINLYGREITERKKAEEAVKQSEERLKRAQEIAHLGSWELDLVKNQLTWSDEAYRIFGLQPQEFTATYEAFLEAVHPDDRLVVDRTYTESIKKGWDNYEIEHRIVKRSSGKVRFVHEKCEHFQDESGQIIRSVGMVHDITERKQAEDELKRTLDELKSSNAELEQFAYVASHDLQEPLRGIAGLAQILQQRYQGQLDGQADEYIDLIVDSTQRMQTLINDLLAYSRIGRRGEVLRSTGAEAALKAVLQNLSVGIREYGATITNDSLPTVKADATQLIQLLQNLLANAIKFRAERPPRIHIGVSDAGDCWQFSIRDNGIGIEPQYFERIFQVFQRLHTRREYKGTGIGLAICKKIIDRHGGRIWVESQAGQGSTFYFTLPKGN